MNQKITISATTNSPLALVWEIFTTPKHICQWNFAHVSWHCPSAEVDLRVGGKYLARMAARDGSAAFDFEGVYDAVIPQEYLALTMPDGRKVETSFMPIGKDVRVETTFDTEDQNPVEMQRDGWQAILNNFVAYTEKLVRP